MIACVGIFISLLYLTGMYYLGSAAKIDFKAWDVGTVTAGDFTVEYQIPSVVWKKFEDAHTDHTRSEGADFEDYLKKEFESIISQEPSVLYPNLVVPPSIKIANITFAFNNAKLIALLRTRGSIVAAGQFGKLPPVDVKINELKTHDLQALTKPVSAFITFETQDGYERACELKGTEKCNGEVIADKEFDGAPLFFVEAPEPTNIIWEHRQITYKDQMFRTIVVSVIIVFLLFLAFMAFYTLKQQTVANYKKYPPTTNCSGLYSDFSVPGGEGVTTPIVVSTNTIFEQTAEADKALIKKYGTGTGVY